MRQSRVGSLLASLAAIAATVAPGFLVEANKLVPGYTADLSAVEPYGGKNASILKHPADWSRDVYPIQVHSHNDYWRDSPVYDALAHGVMSIESDVWLNPDDGELYVGHDPFSLSVERTFHSLTLDPLKKAIDQANAANHLVSSSTEESSFFANLQKQQVTTLNKSATEYTGFFSGGVGLGAPIQLLVDLKTEGNSTYKKVVEDLEPLRKAGYLTRYEAGKVIPGPLLIIGTGNSPAAVIAATTSRAIFLDCPLGAAITKGFDAPDGTHYDYNKTLCGIASVDFGSLVPGFTGVDNATDAQRQNLTTAINAAHSLGIKTRLWDTPQWPTYARDSINKLLLTLGSVSRALRFHGF